MSRVFIVQQSMVQRDGKWVPKFNVSSAAEFGELISLSDHLVKWEDLEWLVKTFRRQLFDFSEDDYLLLIGNPVLIGAASVIAAENVDVLNFVQWDKKSRMYLAVSIDLR